MKAYVKFASQVIFIFFAVVSSASSGKGHLRQTWKLRLAEIVQSSGFKPSAFSIFGLSFSPDGQRIAVVYGPTWKEENVLILDATDPKANVRKLDINPQYWESSIPPTASYMRWAGENVGIQRFMIQLSKGSSCAFHDYTFALPFASDKVIRSDFKYYDWGCNYLGAFEHPADWRLLDVSAERKLLCVRQDVIRNKRFDHSDILIVDAIKKTTLFMVLSRPTEKAKFADSGKLICGTPAFLSNQSVSCWDVDTEKEISTSRRHGYLDFQPALNSTKIALSEYGRKFYWLGLEWGLGSVKQRVVWDCRTGEEIASWRPKYQEAVTSRGTERQAYRFAISPDGEFIVEGGAGELIMSKIEPGQRDQP